MYWSWIIAVMVGGIAGWWYGRSRTATDVNRSWMQALEEAQLDNIITEEQSSQIIRIQGAARPRP